MQTSRGSGCILPSAHKENDYSFSKQTTSSLGSSFDVMGHKFIIKYSCIEIVQLLTQIAPIDMSNLMRLCPLKDAKIKGMHTAHIPNLLVFVVKDLPS